MPLHWLRDWETAVGQGLPEPPRPQMCVDLWGGPDDGMHLHLGVRVPGPPVLRLEWETVNTGETREDVYHRAFRRSDGVMIYRYDGHRS